MSNMKKISKKLIVLGVVASMAVVTMTGCGFGKTKEVDKSTVSSSKKNNSEKKSNTNKMALDYEELKQKSFAFYDKDNDSVLTLEIDSDGSFSGTYSLYDEKSAKTKFRGEFPKLKEESDSSVTATVESLKYTKEASKLGETTKLSEGDKIVFIKKDAKVADLPKMYMSSLETYLSTVKDVDKLPFCGCYNETTKIGFYDDESNNLKDINRSNKNEAENDSQQQAAEQNQTSSVGGSSASDYTQQYNVALQKDSQLEANIQATGTMPEMVKLSEERYKLWDDELNSLWKKLKSTLDSQTMDKLTQDERAWIKDKEDHLLVYDNMEGPKSSALVSKYEDGADITKKRVEYLMQYLE